jgi:methyl-accepting chemotaxis protein
MSSDTHSDPVQHDHTAASDDFVVPEPDGVQSGIPFDVSERKAPHIPPRAPPAPRHGDIGLDTEHAMQARTGMSLKLKLLLSLGLLTGVILALGIVSVLALRGISGHGMAELQRHAQLARGTETLVTAIHRMYESAQDMLRDDVGANERLQRRLGAVHEDLAELEAQAARIDTVERDLAATHATMEALVDDYEHQIEAYQSARTAAAERRDAERAAAATLTAELSARLAPAAARMAEVSAAHWQHRGTGDGDAAVAGGLALAGLERDLWRISTDVQRFHATGQVALAEAARATLSEVLAQLDVARGEAVSRAVREGLADVREQLLAYGALLRDAGERIDADRAAQAQQARELADQGRTLREHADRVLQHAEQLAADAWRDIDRESEALSELGAATRWLVGATAAIGAFVGVLVLVTVPRPIVRSIDALLDGAREIARGNLTTPVQGESRDELGQLAATFEHMRRNLLALVQRIQRASVQLSSSINEIQAATTEQASSASQQASAVNELTSSLNEMSQSASTLLSSSESVGGNVGEIAQTLNESDQSSTRILASMDAIGLSTEQTAARIKALNDKMDDINEAVATISMVADQTTLLSLNASIEANKAGEMGKGFSVVANEIRRLSDRSIDSAGNINGMVRDIQRATESSALAMDKSAEEIRHGVTLVRESIEALASINRGMERIQEQMGMILESVRAQAESSRMVQSTATEMLSSANMVSKAASQTRSVTYELNAMATQLASAVSVFKV